MPRRPGSAAASTSLSLEEASSPVQSPFSEELSLLLLLSSLDELALASSCRAACDGGGDTGKTIGEATRAEETGFATLRFVLAFVVAGLVDDGVFFKPMSASKNLQQEGANKN